MYLLCFDNQLNTMVFQKIKYSAIINGFFSVQRIINSACYQLICFIFRVPDRRQKERLLIITTLSVEVTFLADTGRKSKVNPRYCKYKKDTFFYWCCIPCYYFVQGEDKTLICKGRGFFLINWIFVISAETKML